jgi:uncharacterized RDD family membrane protein YckC
MWSILASVCWTRRVQYYEEPPAVLPFAYAAWPRRIASAIIDLFVITALTAPFIAPTINRAFENTSDPTKVTLPASDVRTLTIVSIIAQVVYFTAMHAWRGASVGKMATRTTLVRDDGSPVTPAVAFTRAVTLVGINFLSSFLIAVPAVVNMLRPLWSPTRQTWHDQIAKTVVVLNSPR